MTLGEARRELRSIINELWSIENGIRSEFDGIGENYCADCIARISRKYERNCTSPELICQCPIRFFGAFVTGINLLLKQIYVVLNYRIADFQERLILIARNKKTR